MRISKSTTWPGIIALALLAWSCRDFSGPFSPGSPDYVGIEWARDSDNNGIADSVEKYYPGCRLGPKECVAAAQALSRLAQQPKSLAARDMILWQGDPAADPRLAFTPPELGRGGFLLSSSDSQIVLPKDGKLTGLKEGQAQIHVESPGLSLSATFLAKVVATGKKVQALASASDLSLAVGKEAAPSLAWTPSDATYKDYALISENPLVVAAAGGKVKGLAVGAAKVTAEALDGGTQAVFTVTVTPDPTILVDSLRAEDMHLVAGDAATAPQLTWTPQNATHKEYQLASRNPAVADVNAAKDRVLAKAPGETQVVVITLDGSGKTAQFTVRVSAKPIPVQGIAAGGMSLIVGGAPEAPKLVWNPADASNRNYTLASDKPAVAAVFGGLVRPLSAGAARFTVTTADGGFKAVFQVSVIAPDTTLHVDSVQVADMDLAIGTDRVPAITWYPQNAAIRDYTLTSLQPGIAEVAGAAVHAKAAGQATLKLETKDRGRTATFKVNVFQPDIPVQSVAAQPMQLWVADPAVTPTLTWNPPNATDKRYRLTSDNALVASIEADTLVRPLAPGNARITLAAANGVTGSFPVTVSARLIPPLAISAPAITLKVGDPDQAIAVVFFPPETSDKSFTIKGSNNTKVAVPVAGTKVRAVGPGQAVLAVETSGLIKLAASCTVTVSASLASLQALDLTMRIGESRPPALTWNPVNTSDKSYSMTSDNTGVVAIEGPSLLAVGAGQANVRVVAGDGGKTADFKVTVVVPVISLSAADMTLEKGKEQAPVLTWNPADATDKSYTLSSKNTGVATIANNRVRGAGVGAAVITVTSGDGGRTANFTATVTEAPVPVQNIKAGNLALKVDEVAAPALAWTPANATNKGYSLSSDNTAVAAILNGQVRAVSSGSAKITVTTEDGGKTDTFTVTVTESTVAVQSIAAADLTLKVDQAASPSLTWTPANATNKGFALSSQNTSVAVVAGNQVKGVAAGKTTVTVITADGGKTASFAVTVTENAVAVQSVLAADMVLTVGDPNADPALTWTPANATNKGYTLSSQNTAVAAIAGNQVRAVAAGTAGIVVTAADGGKTANFTVTVKEKTFPVEAIGAADMAMKVGDADAAPSLTWTPANATNKGFALVSQAPEVASIAGTRIHAAAPGTATVTVTSEDGGKTASFTVTVAQDSVPVQSVGAADLSLKVGDPDASPALTWTPANATNKGFSLVSQAPEVASIVGAKVHAVAKGTATVTVTTGDGGKTASFTVTVTQDSVPVDSVKAEDMSLGLGKDGAGAAPVLTWYPANAMDKAYSLVSADPSISGISGGKVIPLKKGKTEVQLIAASNNRSTVFKVQVKDNATLPR